MGNPSGLDKPRPDKGKGVKVRFNPTYPMGGKGGPLNMIPARGLELSDRVWYNAIYYIAYSYNPKGANYQCKLSLHSSILYT